MSKEKMTQVLTSPNKEKDKPRGPGGLLATLYREFLNNNDIGMTKWNDFMAAWLNDPKRDFENRKTPKSSVRTNIIGSFFRDEMTIKEFITALNFHQVVSFEITLKAVHKNGKSSIHTVGGDFDDDIAEVVDIETPEDKPK